MDIIVYSHGEFEYLDKKESDFIKEIKSTGVEIYANKRRYSKLPRFC
jgi:predicted peroxiredoxin